MMGSGEGRFTIAVHPAFFTHWAATPGASEWHPGKARTFNNSPWNISEYLAQDHQ